jgi:Condensation domain/Phosphopantetheine attachment site
MVVQATRKETDLWLLERLVPGSGVNNLSLTFDVDGELDRAALSRALTLVVRKFDILRTVFTTTETELTKRVLPPGEAEVEVVVSDVEESDPQAAVEEFVSAPFALDGGLLVRADYFRVAGGSDVVCVALHHLVFDAMSTVMLLGELITAYQAVTAGTPGAYSIEPVAAVVEPEPGEESVEFWRDHLRGFRGGGEGLWYGNPPAATPDLAGDTMQYFLSAEAREVVQRLQRELRAPEAVILLAAYYLLLSRHGAGSDIVVGSPVSVRPAGHETAIGYHVNVLPLRVKVDLGRPFKRLVNRARGIFLEGLGHSGVTAESVLDEVRDSGASWRNSLFSHLFNYVPGGTSGSFEVGGHQARIRPVENGFSKFDLEFFFMPEAEQTKIRAVFRTQVFSRDEVGLLLARYDALLCSLGADTASPVGELSVWSTEDRAAVEAAHRPGGPGSPTALPTPYYASPATAQFSRYARIVGGAALPEELASDGVRVLVADPSGAELPVGVRGELCLANGRIVPTGDVARWLADGRIEILGRAERRVTVQGVTFGLEEVDAALLAHPAVETAVTVAVTPVSGTGDPVLVSYVAATREPDLLDHLWKQVRAELPGPAEPHRIVIAEALPAVGATPDLQGLRLRAEELLRAEAAVTAVSEAVDTEELKDALVALWREFLKRDDLAADSGFFTSGGHSLLGVQLIQRIKRTTGIKVKVRLADLFANPTPEKLSHFISTKTG